MGSKREEERNEKIIRGLMKLPPNRKCINCNSLGPQYVCTNFWTFVCTTCSGIHREFTHRVKSVSMAKFTSQEVEALQNGGNQCARELYLKNWDFQGQRFPNNSNADKIREFIKHVYMDKKYAGGRISDKPPRDSLAGSHEDETRRASSYHSYSQSPPYDHQYEDRRYGKHSAALTRKPGSDKGLYIGKISSFVSSPGRLSEQMYEEKFANEGSVSRFSDYSVSSGGDPVRSGIESPSFQDGGFISSPVQSSKGVSNNHVPSRAVSFSTEANIRRDAERVPPPQRSKSSGCIGSFDSGSPSLKSYNSGSLVDVVQEPEYATGAQKCSLDTSKAPIAKEVVVPLDLFHLPEAPQSVNFFATDVHHHSVPIVTEKPVELSVPKNEGWASFDTQPGAAQLMAGNVTPAVIPANSIPFANFDQVSLTKSSMQWPSLSNPTSHGLMPDPQHDILHNVKVPTNTAISQSWNAFEEPATLTGKQSIEPQAPLEQPSFTFDHYTGLKAQETTYLPSQVFGLSYTPPPPQMKGAESNAVNHKSTNPFDAPYDTVLEQPDMFLDIASMHVGQPDTGLSSSYLSGVAPSWFPQDPITAYIPTASQSGLAFMGGQPTSSQLPNVQSQGSLASIGGNPFA